MNQILIISDEIADQAKNAREHLEKQVKEDKDQKAKKKQKEKEQPDEADIKKEMAPKTKKPDVKAKMLRKILPNMGIKNETTYKALIRIGIRTKEDLYIFMNKPIGAQAESGEKHELREFLKPRYFRHLLITRQFDNEFFERHLTSICKKYANSMLTDLRLLEPQELDEESKTSKARLMQMGRPIAKITNAVISFIKEDLPEIVEDIEYE